MKISPLVWILFILIADTFVIILLANGIRELINPDWINPDWIHVIAWVETIFIAVLSIINVFLIIFLFWLITKFISIEELEKAFYKLKNED